MPIGSSGYRPLSFFTLLYVTGTVVGTLGVVLLLLSAVFVLTALVGTCPIYQLVGISTCPIDSKTTRK